jgi:DNA anti-recombination protein RmuC
MCPVDQTVDVDGLSPEEAELFKEFEGYVRSVYVAATRGATTQVERSAEAIEAKVNSLTSTFTAASQHCHARLQEQIDSLTKTVSASRDAYADLFAPAIARFDDGSRASAERFRAQTETTVASLSETLATTHSQAQDRANSDLQAWQSDTRAALASDLAAMRAEVGAAISEASRQALEAINRSSEAAQLERRLLHKHATRALIVSFCVTVAVIVGCTAYLVSALSGAAAR